MMNHLTFVLFGLILNIFIVQGLELPHGVGNYGIFSGQDASEGQFPYQVSIQLCTTWPIENCKHFCGGSIISPSWILTAGHCWEYNYLYKIVAGIVKRSEESEYKQVIEVNQTIVHQDYIGNANPNDIRLYQLKTLLVFNERVQPIQLPEANSNFTGNATASGWGYTSAGIFPVVPDTLQYQVSNMPDGETCLELANAISMNNHFNITTNICTENPEKNHGICNGDSGGPLVKDGKLVGISSWGFIPCGQKKAPSCFTRVSNYIDWIKDRVPEL